MIKVINASGKVLEVDEKKASLLTRNGVWKKFDGAMPVDAVLGAEIVEKERVELVAKIEAFEAEKAAFEAEKAAFYASKEGSKEVAKEESEVVEKEPSKRGRKPKEEIE